MQLQYNVYKETKGKVKKSGEMMTKCLEISLWILISYIQYVAT